MITLSRLWVTEWIVGAFFAYLILLALVFRLPRHHRARVVAVGLVCITLSVMLSQLRLSPVLQVTREWLPAVFLVQGYWLCGLFFHQPMRGIERGLLSFDQTVLRALGGSHLLERGPRAVLEYFELTYLFVYAFVPGCLGLFCWLGHRAAADNYWTAVLIAGLGAYGMLPWIQTRPPRSIEQPRLLDTRGLFFRRLNLSVLNHASVQVNTLPSGHASTAIASVHIPLGLVVLVLACSITLATVLGRYHFVLDSILGAALGFVAWWVGFGLLGDETTL